jgi:hypothetical protein
MKYDIPVPQHKIVRRTDQVFPSYRYVPGVHPHPFRHPQGHMSDEKRIFRTSDTLVEDEAFLFGCDLFDFCYWWEAHEVWEACWLRSKGIEKECIQGLIQLSASLLKHHMGHVSPRDRLFARACSRLEHAILLGWSLEETIEQARRFFCGGEVPILGASFWKSDKSQPHEVSKCSY